MRVYHKHLHEYATVIRKVADNYIVRYDGDTQMYEAKVSYFDEVKLEDAE